jgi:hypothetical protein
MRIKSLTYVSKARPGLRDDDIAAIHHIALDLNVLDGITGLLIYNGERFLQIVEGAEDAVDDLLRRLLADPRHSELTVVDERFIGQPQFPDWSMKLAKVSVGYLQARDDIVRELPGDLPHEVEQRVLELTVSISRKDG